MDCTGLQGKGLRALLRLLLGNKLGKGQFWHSNFLRRKQISSFTKYSLALEIMVIPYNAGFKYYKNGVEAEVPLWRGVAKEPK